MKKLLLAAAMTVACLSSAHATNYRFFCTNHSDPTNNPDHDGVFVAITNGAAQSFDVVHTVSKQLYNRQVQYRVTSVTQPAANSYVWEGFLLKDPNVIMTGHLWENEGVWMYTETQRFIDGQPPKTATPPVVCHNTNTQQVVERDEQPILPPDSKPSKPEPQYTPPPPLPQYSQTLPENRKFDTPEEQKLEKARNTPQPSQGEPIVTDCDTYAASPLDPGRKTDGVFFEKLNPILAIPACENAVRQDVNSSRLLYQLGRAYQKNKEFSLALVQYRMAAEQGYAAAQYNLGIVYRNGLGIPQDFTEAVKWFRLAAEQGYAMAQYNLGVVYHDGMGVPQDFAEAVKWFRLAAEQGDTAAQNNLGVMYAVGQGVPRDFAEAIKWYRLAAALGDAEALNNLVAMYAGGLNVPQDFWEAVKWYRLAAAQGDVMAKKNLATLDAQSSSAISLSSADLPKIVSTYRENEMRFKRDFFGKQFSDVLPFRSATENVFSKGTYIVGFGTGGLLSDLDCNVTSQEKISIIADWNKGDRIRVEGIVNDVNMVSVRLDPCSLSKLPASVGDVSAAYKQMSLTDFKLDREALAGARVQIIGQLHQFAQLVALGSSLFDTTPIFIDIKGLPREQQKTILERCNTGCEAVVKGRVDTVFMQTGLIADDVSIR